jgi:cytochrome bd-type quinol oxidase subunit 2
VKVFRLGNISVRRFDIYIGITLLVSIGLNWYTNGPYLNFIIGGVLFQFLASLILGYVFSQFRAKYKKNDWRKIWLTIYVFMVSSSIILVILGLYPMN